MTALGGMGAGYASNQDMMDTNGKPVRAGTPIY
jgi:hypothetical protein